MDENLSSDDALFWSQPTPINCDTVRIVGIFLCIATFIGIILNGALVYSFGQYKVLRSPPNIYVMFIAIMGLLASCTILPLTGTSSIYCKWLYKRIGCQLSAVIAFLYGCSSSYLLCIVSLSRCYIIIRPFDANKVTVTKSVVISCFAVLLAFIWAILPVIGWNEYIMQVSFCGVSSISGARISCCINWYDRRVSYVSFTFFLFIFVYFIPLVILIVSNTITLIGLKHMREKYEHGIKTALNWKRIEMERRIVKGIIITTCGFIFTWTPYAIAFFVSAFRGKDYAISPWITFYCACFAKTSVMWIPLLYISTSTQFQLSLVNLNASNYQTESTHEKDGTPRTLNIVRNNDGSIIVRAVSEVPEKMKPILINTNTCSV